MRSYCATPMMSYKALQGLEAAFSGLHPPIHTPQEEKPSFRVFVCHTGILNSSVPAQWKLADCGLDESGEVLFTCWHILKDEVHGLQRFTQLSHKKKYA